MRSYAFLHVRRCNQFNTDIFSASSIAIYFETLRNDCRNNQSVKKLDLPFSVNRNHAEQLWNCGQKLAL